MPKPICMRLDRSLSLPAYLSPQERRLSPWEQDKYHSLPAKRNNLRGSPPERQQRISTKQDCSRPMLLCWFTHGGMGFEAAWIDGAGSKRLLCEQAWNELAWAATQVLEADELPRAHGLIANHLQQELVTFAIWQHANTLLPEPYSCTFQLGSLYGLKQEPFGFPYYRLPKQLKSLLTCAISIHARPWLPAAGIGLRNAIPQVATQTCPPPKQHLAYDPFWPSRLAAYLALLQHPQTWGQDIELEAIGYLIGRPIVVYGFDVHTLVKQSLPLRRLAVYGPLHGLGKHSPIVLYWQGMHYAFLRCSSSELPEQLTLPVTAIENVPADGSCLFHAVCKGLLPAGRHDALSLRQATIGWLRQHALTHVPSGELIPLIAKMDIN